METLRDVAFIQVCGRFAEFIVLENIMRKIRHTSVIPLALGCLLTPQAFGQRCGKERWAVKTGTDSGANSVNSSRLDHCRESASRTAFRPIRFLAFPKRFLFSTVPFRFRSKSPILDWLLVPKPRLMAQFADGCRINTSRESS